MARWAKFVTHSGEEDPVGAMQASGRKVYFFGALGGLLFGYDTGVISGAILFITKDWKVSPFVEGAIVAGLLLGAMIGAATAGRLSDRLGRRRLIMIAAGIFALRALGAPTAGGPRLPLPLPLAP